MNGHEYILRKQVEWAHNRCITLLGSRADRGRPVYVPELSMNLFEPLLPDVLESLRGGDGNEIGSSKAPGKMQAVHSSSALGVNVFQYWKRVSDVPAITAACGLCKPGSNVYSAPNRSAIPRDADHLIHAMPISENAPWRSAIPAHADQISAETWNR